MNHPEAEPASGSVWFNAPLELRAYSANPWRLKSSELEQRRKRLRKWAIRLTLKDNHRKERVLSSCDADWFGIQQCFVTMTLSSSEPTSLPVTQGKIHAKMLPFDALARTRVPRMAAPRS
jgi:hypothetical protein